MRSRRQKTQDSRPKDRVGFTPLLCVLAVVIAVLAGRAPAQTLPASMPTGGSSLIPMKLLPTALPPTTGKKAPRPTTAVDPKGCVTSECHGEVKNYKVVHGPVNVNACDACHKVADVSQHTFALPRDKTQLCTFCHKIETTGMAVVHKPVTTGDCLPCHNPHGGKTAKFIRGGSTREVCDQCHKDVIGNKKNVHGPVAAGACEACHMPHAAQNPKLLVAEGKRLCVTCHKEMSDQMKLAKVTHKPVAEGECSGCHDPHASDYTMQTKAAPFDLCTSCHTAIKKAATESQHKHSIVVKDQACLNCHTAHGAQLAKLMRNQPLEVCLKCHKEAVKTPDGREVKSVGEVLDPKLAKHGPVKEGNCSGCHNVHGSDVTRLLAKPYPETFYAKFDEQNFGLCFSCHDKKLVEAKEAEGLTGFRDGVRNLHFVHVNKERGRTCRACHETHASKNPLHLRDTVPYGQWELPINYKKTDTGGSCSPGCHKELAYDRKAAVKDTAATEPKKPEVTPEPKKPESSTEPRKFELKE